MNEISITAIKVVLGLIPTFGTPLNEVLFEHRSRVKQKRINDFVQSLSDYLINIKIENPSTDHILSDEFGDIFEAIIRQVSRTNSKEKALRFKLILANKILNQKPSDFIDTYIEIIGTLNDVQIQILQAHINSKAESIKDQEELSDALDKYHSLKKLGTQLKSKAEKGTIGTNESIAENEKNIANVELNLNRLRDDSNKNIAFRMCLYYGLNEGDFLFFKQDLVAKGLMSDVGIGKSKGQPYLIMDITQFGKGLLNFIQE